MDKLNVPEILENDFPSRHFPFEIAREANSLGIDHAELAERPLVRGITIDNESTVDIDDGIWVEATPDGGYNVQISIADVASVVPEGSLIDNEALFRAFSRYRGDGVMRPMLPRTLSEDRLSLIGGVVRPALTLEIKFDRDLKVVDRTVSKTRFRSLARLSYDKVDDLIRDKESSQSKKLQTFQELAQRLFRMRTSNGALTVFRPADGLGISEDGQIIKLQGHGAHGAHLIIQELMILANTEIARFMSENAIVGIYRNHNRTLISQSLLDDLRALEDGHPEMAAKLMRTLNARFQRAQYSAERTGHFALAVDAYTHFTSPLRRYADLIVHRALLRFLDSQEPFLLSNVETISAYINCRVSQAQDHSVNFFRKRRMAEVQKLIEEKDVQELADLDEEFLELIKLFIDTDLEIPDKFWHAVEQRMLKKKLTISEAILILTEMSNDKVKPIIDYVCKVLETSLFLNNFLEGQQLNGLSYEFVESDSGFRCRYLCPISGKILTSQKGGFSLRKDEARHSAAVEFLMDFMREALVEKNEKTDNFVQHTMPEMFRSLDNPSALLTLRCQQLRLPPFEKEVQRIGGKDDNPHFAARIIVSLSSGKAVTEYDCHGNQKDALRGAAALMLKKLENEQIPLPDTKSLENPISDLSEFCQENRIDTPIYDYHSIGNSSNIQFLCSCTLILNGESRNFIGKGYNKKEAKAAAAAAALEAALAEEKKRILNPIERLHLLFQSLHFPFPNFDYETTKGAISTCEISNFPPDFMGKTKFTATSKKGAKVLACKALLDFYGGR